MATQPSAHIEPSSHSTEQVDEFLRHVEDHVDPDAGAGSPAIKPKKDLGKGGKPVSDTQDNQSI
jgi:hypothetical protein